MKFLFKFLLLMFCFMIFNFRGEAAMNPYEKIDYKQAPVLERDYRTSYEMRGFISNQANNLAKNWAMVCEKQNPQMLGAFDKRNDQPYQDILPWSGEFPGKFLRGFTQLERLTGDENLKEYLYGFVERLVSKQAENGYIGVWDVPFELTGQGHPSICGTITWDLWNHYHIMQGLLFWYQDTGDKKALDCAVRIGDLFCEKFLDDFEKLSLIPDPYTNWAIGHSMTNLYKITGDEKYLRFCEKIINEAFVHKTPNLRYVERALNGEAWYENKAHGGVRWEGIHPILILSEMYLLTGNEDYKTAIENIFWGIAEYDRHSNGGFTSMEQANGNPYDVRSVETCCTIAWEALAVEALRISGKSIYADELEITLMNAALGFLSKDGNWTSYNTPMEGIVVPSEPNSYWTVKNNDIDCCTVNAARGIGILSDWAVMSSKEGIALNWFGDGKFTTYYKGNSVQFNVTGDYPRKNSVNVEITPEKSDEFEIAFKIPFWSKNTVVSVNGKAVDNVKSGDYLRIKRTWNKEDFVKIDFDFNLRYWVGENESDGRVSIYRGPVLLALKRQNVNDYAQLGEGWLERPVGRHLPYFRLYHSETPNSVLKYEFKGNYISWLYNKFDYSGIAQILIDGKEVDKVDLFGKDVINEDLFGYDAGRKDYFLSTRWERDNLGDGSHIFEIVATGEKNPESKGAFVNVRELLSYDTDPVFDMKTIKEESLIDTKDDLIAIKVKDVFGNEFVLNDYDSAAETEKFFITWFRAINETKTPFSKDNPFKLSEVK